MATLVLPSWVVPPTHAVEECDRVARRRLELGPYRATTRDTGVASTLVWLTLGDASPMTRRFGGGVFEPAGRPDDSSDRSVKWTSSATWEMARAESWVALCLAAGAPAPIAEDWRRLSVEPAPAVTDDREFAYGAWRALSWLLGVREDFPIYTSWHRAAGLAPDRPHLRAPLRACGPDEAWRAAERASRDQAEADARRYWVHVRARVDATA